MPRAPLTTSRPLGQILPAAAVNAVGDLASADNHVMALTGGLNYFLAWHNSGTPTARVLPDPAVVTVDLNRADGTEDRVQLAPGAGESWIAGPFDLAGWGANLNLDATTGGCDVLGLSFDHLARPARGQKLGTTAPDAGRVTIPSITLPAPGDAPGTAQITTVTGDTVNGHRVAGSGLDLIMAWSNTGSHLLTVKGEPDHQGRANDFAVSVADSFDFVFVGPFQRTGYLDSGGFLNVDVASTQLELAVLRVPH